MTYDAMLANLVDATNSMLERVNPATDTVGVTLFVNGQVITGKLIPTWQMYEDMGKGNGSPTDAPGPFGHYSDQIKDEQRHMNELLDKDSESLTDEEKELIESSEPHFVNLADAKWAGGDGRLVPTSSAVPIRVKLDSVDAFTFGTVDTGSVPKAPVEH